MTLTLILVLVIVAFICAIAAALNKAPLWVSVILLCIIEMVRVLPIGK